MSGPKTKLSEHFALDEFKCHDGTAPPADFAETIKDTVEFLERLRGMTNERLSERTGKPENVGLIIVSGYRTKSYNRKCGGAKNSRHVTGQAADVKPARAYDKLFSYTDFRALAESVDESFHDRPYRLGFYPDKAPARGYTLTAHSASAGDDGEVGHKLEGLSHKQSWKPFFEKKCFQTFSKNFPL